jgi:hypothetical protein
MRRVIGQISSRTRIHGSERVRRCGRRNHAHDDRNQEPDEGGSRGHSGGHACSALTTVPSVLRIPIRMRGPLPASEAGRPRPSMQTSGADTARLERVPGMATQAEPAVVGRRGPVASRAPNVRFGRTVGRGIFDLSLGRSREGGHSHHCQTGTAGWRW